MGLPKAPMRWPRSILRHQHKKVVHYLPAIVHLHQDKCATIIPQNRNLLTTPDGGYTPRGGAVINQTPFKRFGNPDELKGALVWLLSDASQFVTGAMICVDGGFSIFGGV